MVLKGLYKFIEGIFHMCFEFFFFFASSSGNKSACVCSVEKCLPPVGRSKREAWKREMAEHLALRIGCDL